MSYSYSTCNVMGADNQVILPETRAYVRYLRDREQLNFRRIGNIVGISKSAAWRICVKPNKPKNVNSRPTRLRPRGRPSKIGLRLQRRILREMLRLRATRGNFTVRHIMTNLKLDSMDISARTVSRFLNTNGYRYRQARKKGLLSRKDLKTRLNFARGIKQEQHPAFWMNDIAFYFDATSFAYKTQPKLHSQALSARVWRKKNEGLLPGCTAKGRKVGTGGKVVHVHAAISHGKGVVLAKPYSRLSGKRFAKFVRKHFPAILERCQISGQQRTFLQDGDPSQNSERVKKVLGRLSATVFNIPPRSPDLNPIENVFKLLGDQLRDDALEQNIERETFREFRRRVVKTLLQIPANVIDRIIESMPKRIDSIIRARGGRLKY